MRVNLNATQRVSIHGEFQCHKHQIFHINSILDRLGGLGVPNV
jgi:hypothetical protein